MLLALDRLAIYRLIDVLCNCLLMWVDLLRSLLLSLIKLLLSKVRLSTSTHLLDWSGSSSWVYLLSLLWNLHAQSFDLERRNWLGNAAVECRKVRVENTVL